VSFRSIRTTAARSSSFSERTGTRSRTTLHSSPAGAYRRPRIRPRAPDLPDLLAQRGGVPLQDLDGGEEESRGGEEADHRGISPVDLGPQRPDPRARICRCTSADDRLPDPSPGRRGDADDVEDRHRVPGAEFAFLEPGEGVPARTPSFRAAQVMKSPAAAANRFSRNLFSAAPRFRVSMPETPVQVLRESGRNVMRAIRSCLLSVGVILYPGATG